MIFRNKLIFFIILVCFSVSIITISIYYIYNYNLIISDVKSRNLQLAKKQTLKLESWISKEIDIATLLAQSDVIQHALDKSNQEFKSLSPKNRALRIQTLNQRWINIASINSPFIQRYTDNLAAQFLKRVQSKIPDHYGEIFVTDTYGALSATTNKLTTFAHSHKYWWKASYAQGKGVAFIDDRGFDDSVGGYVLGIVVPVKNNGQVIGILKCNVNIIKALQNIINSNWSDKDIEIKIARLNGQIVLEKGLSPLSTKLSDALLTKVEALTNKDNGIFEDTGKVYGLSIASFTKATAAIPEGQIKAFVW